MSKLVRVELEYEDGTVKTLEGDDAKMFEKQTDDAFMMGYIHGSKYESLPWDIKKKSKKKGNKNVKQ